MSVFKFKPLGSRRIHLQIVNDRSEVVMERMSQIGEYLDITIPDGCRAVLTPEVISEPAISDARDDFNAEEEIQVHLVDEGSVELPSRGADA